MIIPENTSKVECIKYTEKGKIGKKKEKDIYTSTNNNGKGYVISGRAKGIANYPHMREYGGMLYVSGTSCRRPNNTHFGVTKNEKGEVIEKDIRLQTKAVLENIKLILNRAGAGLEHLVQTTVSFFLFYFFIFFEHKKN